MNVRGIQRCTALTEGCGVLFIALRMIHADSSSLVMPLS